MNQEEKKRKIQRQRHQFGSRDASILHCIGPLFFPCLIRSSLTLVSTWVTLHCLGYPTRHHQEPGTRPTILILLVVRSIDRSISVHASCLMLHVILLTMYHVSMQTINNHQGSSSFKTRHFTTTALLPNDNPLPVLWHVSLTKDKIQDPEQKGISETTRSEKLWATHTSVEHKQGARNKKTQQEGKLNAKLLFQSMHCLGTALLSFETIKAAAT
ncbi:hypothetical protein V8C26DRAFT_389070 [Trichoderma gracile]